MNEPTEAAVEAAARAIADEDYTPSTGDGAWDALMDAERDDYRRMARAALTAAAQVQPAPRTVTAEDDLRAAREAGAVLGADGDDTWAWHKAYLAALGITVEVPR